MPYQGSWEHRNSAHLAEQQTRATRDVERATKDGLTTVALATGLVHEATEGVRQATAELAVTTEEVAGWLALVNTSVGQVDQAVVNLERTVAAALSEVSTEVSTVASAVKDMDAASGRLQFWSIALAVVATLAAVVSVALGVATM